MQPGFGVLQGDLEQGFGVLGDAEQGFGVLQGPGRPRKAGATLQAWQHARRTCYFLPLIGALEMHGSGLLVFRKISQIIKHFSQKGAYSSSDFLMGFCSSHRVTSFPWPAAAHKPRPRISPLFPPQPSASHREQGRAQGSFHQGYKHQHPNLTSPITGNLLVLSSLRASLAPLTQRPGCSSLHPPFAVSCSVSRFTASLLLASLHAQMPAYATSSFYYRQ